ncbi:Diapolycopene oxygenase [anaerobic digester metagenome]
MRASVIGSGVGGLASAIRLAVKGYKVTLFEKQGRVGGKLGELRIGDFRFDTGPSLFTLPTLVDELFNLAGDVGLERFSYRKLQNITRYFYPDGVTLNAWADVDRFASEMHDVLNEPELNVRRYLRECEKLYGLTSKTFMFSPFPSKKAFFSDEGKAIGKNVMQLKAFESMHSVNSKSFVTSHAVQLFDRFATYNGSNPYKAPGTLTVIPHLEHNVGAFFPEKGMYSIASSMEALAKKLGVEVVLNSRVQAIESRRGRIAGVKVNGVSAAADIVVNDTDIFTAYPELLSPKRLSAFYKMQKPSSSALIFYWGVKGNFPKLDLHNILFSSNYKGEFNSLMRKDISIDPTVYIFISAKAVPTDAPMGHENWFVMVNAPEDCGQNWDELVKRTRIAIVEKIKRTLVIDVEPLIVCENVLTPPLIEQRTGSYRGALYGISSNNPFAAFSRHPNRSRSIQNLYFVGGSVHPGGGIPLCLASAKIVDEYISEASL